jgi:hypothetical protein
MMSSEYKVESDFEYKGHRCVVLFQDLGHRCGYVSIDKTSRLYGKDQSDYLDVNKEELYGEEVGKRSPISILLAALDDDNDSVTIGLYFNVHGGITYCGGGENSKYPVKSNYWWFGFDCAHYMDNIDTEKLMEYFPDSKFTKSRIENAIMFDSGYVRYLDYVEQECRNLVDQIEGLEEKWKI